MKITTNKLFLVLFTLAVGAALVYAFMPQPVPVDLAPIQRGPMSVTVDEDGKTRIRERYIVAAPLSGRLQRITLEAGDEVRTNDTLLAVIEPSDPALLDVRSRAEAEARVSAAEAVLNQSTPNLERARAQSAFARNELERARKGLASGIFSEQTEEEAALRARVAAQDLNAAEYAVRIAEFELEQARAALLRTQPDGSGTTDTARFEIRAPVDGRVLRVLQESAGVVAPGTALLELGDPTDLEVEVDLLSTDAVKITPGAKVYLEHWGGEDALLGSVRLVEPAGFTKISALGVEEQRVWVKIDFDEPAEMRPSLGDAYRVEARIVTWESDDALQVPAGALFRSGEDWAVYVVENDRALQRIVRIGHSNGLVGELLEGLDEGESVILHPSDLVQDGVEIIRR